jgi:hypothetical protein
MSAAIFAATGEEVEKRCIERREDDLNKILP